MPNNPDEQFMQQRLLIASVLSAVALMGYIYIQGPPPAAPVDPPAIEQTTTTQQVTAGGQADPETDPPKAAAGPAGEQPGSPPETSGAAAQRAVETIAAKAETEAVIETDTFKVRFSNRGAAVKSWVLTQYMNANRDGELELVHQKGAEANGYPFEIDLPGGRRFDELNDALFKVTEDPARGGQGPAIVFEYAAAGITARKAFRFEKEGYVLRVESEVRRNGSIEPHLLTWNGGFGDTAQLQDAVNSGTFYYDPRRQAFERNTADDAEDERLINTGPYAFAGINDHFFTATYLPPEGAEELRLETSAVTIVAAGGAQEELFPAIGVGMPGVNNFKVFVGPKKVDILSAVSPELGDAVDFGTVWGFIAVPIFWGLRWTHDNIVANYGWAIVVLTTLINFALFPLKWKSMKSMKKMQSLQPLVKQINDKYKGLGMRDPKKQQQQEEMMALYKTHGVNPLGGCLPMFLQFPFFLGFYNVLSVAIETRHAEWLWVKDLSTFEQLPIHVLPIALVLTQFWQQTVTPAAPTADASQMRLMKFMPLMMGFIFYNVSSGLVLFWLTGNVVGVIQQLLLNKFSSDDEIAIEIPRGRKQKKSKSRA